MSSFASSTLRAPPLGAHLPERLLSFYDKSSCEGYLS
jgi:hypothetical protein